jgi:hypothetical protein
MTGNGWGLVEDPDSLFGLTIVRCYPAVQWFDASGFADLRRSNVAVPQARQRCP